MNAALPPEVFWLVAVTSMTALVWVPYIVNRIGENGLWAALGNREPDARRRAAWAHRMESAHGNAVENLAIFAPPALAVHVTGASTALTAGAAMVFFYGLALLGVL